MELLLVRIDHLRDRKQYVGILRGWLQQIGIGHGRLITVGDLHLLFVVANAAVQNDELLQFFRSKPIDTNSRDEVRGGGLGVGLVGRQERNPLRGWMMVLLQLCVDRFIDVLGRKAVDKCACKSFLEMNILVRAALPITICTAEQEH